MPAVGWIVGTRTEGHGEFTESRGRVSTPSFSTRCHISLLEPATGVLHAGVESTQLSRVKHRFVLSLLFFSFFASPSFSLSLFPSFFPPAPLFLPFLLFPGY